MRRNWIMILALASCMLLSLVPAAQANGDWRSAWQARYGQNPNCGTCHTSVPALNVYGSALASASGQTLDESILAVEDIDSDGGGTTNGQEIVVDGTDPADPADDSPVPNAETSWGAIQALFK